MATAGTDVSVAAEADGVIDVTREAVTGGPFNKKGIGWAIFEWARNPYYNLIVIYIFAPYFATHVVADPVRGQALVGQVIFIAGMIMVPLAPVLGSVVDKAGAKKPFMFFTLLLMGACAASLWFVAPGGGEAAIALGMILLITGYCCYTVTELLHNSMLPGAGAPSAVPMISGSGLAMGNAAGLLLLVIVGFAPHGLSEVLVGRLTGPVVALWFVLFMPFFFFLMPDVFVAGNTWKRSLRQLATLTDTERNLARGIWPFGFFFVKPFKSIREKFRSHPNVMKYLLARMIWSDALGALFAMGAVYVSGFLEWTQQEVIMYSILASIFAVAGGFVGGFLDRRFGPKKALTIELSVIVLIFLFQMSITKDSLLFGLVQSYQVHDATLNGTGVFNSLSDLVYLSTLVPSAVMIVGCISSSRYMLVHIAPPEKIGEFFGFYAMVGSVTLWLGPGLVFIFTMVSNSQRIGISAIGVLFLIGLLLLQLVKADRTPSYLAQNIDDKKS